MHCFLEHRLIFVCHWVSLGAEEKMNVELIVPIGAVVIAMFFWLLIVFVIRNRKRVTISFSLLCLTQTLALLRAD